jgi:hypothetical protein
MAGRKPQVPLWHRLQDGYKFLLTKDEQQNKDAAKTRLERDYNVSATRRMGRSPAQLVKRRTKYFGDALDASFFKNNVVKLDTEAFGFEHKRAIYVHQAIHGTLDRALRAIQKALKKPDAGKKPYKVLTLNGYYFRYPGAPSTDTFLREHEGDYLDVQRWFDEQLAKRRPCVHWLLAMHGKNRRYDWSSKDRRLMAAVYDCFKRKTAPRLSLSSHAWGIAVDFNAGTNGNPDFWDIAPAIVQIMVRHGFYWGGFFAHHDAMHFEYDMAPDARAIASSRRSVLREHLLADVERPHFFFPFTDPAAADSPVKIYHQNETSGSGFYVVGQNRNVHGGIHLAAPAGASSSGAVRVMCPGTIVAARLIAPRTADNTDLVRRFAAGQDLGFVVVRHELAPVKKPGRRSGKGKPRQPEKFENGSAFYSLYMHLAPPSWGGLASDFYARSVPWFQTLLKYRNGSVVNLDPLSPGVGRTLFSAKKIDENAASFEVPDHPPLPARRGEKRIALAKPSPEDIRQALDALVRGCVVTFHEPLLQVEGGEVIGRVKGGFLHWELFSPTGASSGLRALTKYAKKLKVELKEVQETRPDNFLELSELKGLVGKCDPADKAEVDRALEKKGHKHPDRDRYDEALRELFSEEGTFAPQQEKDDAKTKEAGTFCYPVTLAIDNPYSADPELCKKSCTIEVKFTRREGNKNIDPGADKVKGPGESPGAPGVPIGKAGKLVLPNLKEKRFECVVQVPGAADYIELSGKGIFLEPIALDAHRPEASEHAANAALCKSLVGHRFRGCLLKHINEWRPEGLEQLITKLCGQPAYRAGFERLLRAKPDALKEKPAQKAFANKLRALTWWGRKQSKDDPFGEEAVLGPRGKEVSLFGSGKGQLPKDAMLDNLHPVTGLWVLDLLEDAKQIEMREKWPHAFVLRDEDPGAPRLAGFLFAGAQPQLGQEGFAIVVQKGYGSADAVRFSGRSRSSGQRIELGQQRFEAGVALLKLRFGMWGKWRLEPERLIDGKARKMKPAELLPETIDIVKPELAHRTLELAPNRARRGMAGRYDGTLRFKSGCPRALEALVFFRYWVVKPGKKPARGDTGTVARTGLLVTAEKQPRRQGQLVIEDGFITGKRTGRNVRVTYGIGYDELLKVFEGEASAFRFSLELCHQLGQLRRRRGPLTVLRVRADGLSVTVAPRPFSPQKKQTLASAAGKLDKRTTATERDDGVELVHAPDPSRAGALVFECRPAAALGAIVAEAAPAPEKALLVKPGLLAPNGGHAVLADKERPSRESWHGDIDAIKKRCKQDCLELDAGTALPELRTLGVGPIAVLLSTHGLQARVELRGDRRSWSRARPYIEMTGGPPRLRRSTAARKGALVASWRLKTSALLHKTLTFEVKIERPDRVPVAPKLPDQLTYKVDPELVSFTAGLEGQEVVLEGQAHAVPYNVPFKIACERSEAGSWVRDKGAERKLHHLHTDRRRRPVCGGDGSFGATIAASDLGPGEWRFTWSTAPTPERAVLGKSLESKQATVSVPARDAPGSKSGTAPGAKSEATDE